MDNKSLQQIYTDCENAYKTWIKAANISHSYISTKPIPIDKDITPLTIEESEKMQTAYAIEDKARMEYFKILNKYIEYKKHIEK